MNTFIQRGDVITITAPYAITSGLGIMLGYIFGVAQTTAAISTSVPVATRGIFSLAKKSADTFAAGDKVYWDDTNKRVTSTATGNKWVGVALATQVNGDTTMNVRLRDPS